MGLLFFLSFPFYDRNKNAILTSFDYMIAFEIHLQNDVYCK